MSPQIHEAHYIQLHCLQALEKQIYTSGTISRALCMTLEEK